MESRIEGENPFLTNRPDAIANMDRVRHEEKRRESRMLARKSRKKSEENPEDSDSDKGLGSLLDIEA